MTLNKNPTAIRFERFYAQLTNPADYPEWKIRRIAIEFKHAYNDENVQIFKD